MEQIGSDGEEFRLMDKQRSNRTITIKINGNEREYREVTRKKEVESRKLAVEADQSVIDLGSKKIDFTEPSLDSSPPANLEGLTEVAAAQEAVDESFDWILPEENDDDIDEYIIAKQPIEKKKKSNLSLFKKSLPKKQDNGSIKSVFFSILLAVVIGTSFGFLVLKLVITENVDGQKVAMPSTEVTSPTDSNKPATAATGSLQIQPIETYIIQGGVFSTIESAKIEEQRVKQLGVPAQIIENNGQAFLFLGLADSLDKAKSMGAVMKANGIEVFAKGYTLPETNVTKLTEAEVKLLTEMEAVYQTLAALSADGMLSTPLNEAQLPSVKELLLSIDKQEIQSPVIEQIRLDLTGAIEKIENYQKQQTESFMIEAQQHLLSFIQSYLSL
jgi:stage II sporulation protein B